MPNSSSPSTDHPQIAIRLSPQQDAHLEERAAFWVCSKASYIRRLLQEDLSRLQHQQASTAAQG